MDPRAEFEKATGASFFLQIGDRKETEHYLRRQEWLDQQETVLRLEHPGEGNMNQVVRVVTNQRSVILKQSRPWVQKFPQIEAPVGRVLIEARFYELINRDAFFRQFAPQVFGRDPDNYVLLLEDLGKGADFTFIYQLEHTIDATHLEQLMGILSHFHHLKFDRETVEDFPDNLGMRRLNHQHLFVFPLAEDTGFDLDQVQPGLQDIALPYKRDKKLKENMQELGERYLSAGPCLLHGDYFPGSWLKIGTEVKIIDPEFCFFGPPEYDLGVMLAHLNMARTHPEMVSEAREKYQEPAGFDEKLRRKFTGMELIRRLIGLAQLPLDLRLKEKAALLKEAREMVVN